MSGLFYAVGVGFLVLIRSLTSVSSVEACPEGGFVGHVTGISNMPNKATLTLRLLKDASNEISCSVNNDVRRTAAWTSLRTGQKVTALIDVHGGVSLILQHFAPPPGSGIPGTDEETLPSQTAQ